MVDSLPVDITNAVCALVAGLVGGTFHADGSPFVDADTIGVTFGTVAPQPLQAIGVTPYPVSDNFGQGDGVLGVQVWFRGPGRDIRPVLNMQELVFAYFQGRRNYMLGNHPITTSWREITSPQGTDANGRYEYADTYYFEINRPYADQFDY